MPSAITETLTMKSVIDAKAARSRTKSVITWLLSAIVLLLFHFCSIVKQGRMKRPLFIGYG
ncbi:hypothetical protein SJ05684_c09510 [Sinorhizobium sojae CCBAU 05684]|uniref:Uncharacterized protein n=1 Tax=Sinorhizobium sojae CCBAU 05684 TaxID=716928 RepID=A0A249P900_9HYPH|nr:hypothetical protein SJ05684_c09510 [Sinorhizobium sojae CCBAU 05684]